MLATCKDTWSFYSAWFPWSFFHQIDINRDLLRVIDTVLNEFVLILYLSRHFLTVVHLYDKHLKLFCTLSLSVSLWRKSWIISESDLYVCMHAWCLQWALSMKPPFPVLTIAWACVAGWQLRQCILFILLIRKQYGVKVFIFYKKQGFLSLRFVLLRTL